MTAWTQDGPLSGRVSLHVNGVGETLSNEFEQVLDFRAYGEDGQLRTVHRIDSGGRADAGGNILVWKQLVFGATFSQVNGSEAVTLTGTVPHPLQADSPRTIVPQRLGQTYRQRATHIEVGWVLTFPDLAKLEVRLFAGPSLFNVRRDALTNVALTEGPPPFNEVGVSLDSDEQSKSAWGGHVGADVAYWLIDNIGLGGFVRFSQGSMSISDTADATSIDVGAFQGGGGLRVRF